MLAHEIILQLSRPSRARAHLVASFSSHRQDEFMLTGAVLRGGCVLLSVLVLTSCSVTSSTSILPAQRRLVATIAPARAVQAAAADPLRRVVFGHSVNGVPLIALERGSATAPRRVLVVGCVHGDECAGVSVARQVAEVVPPVGAEIVVVPELNPDGHAAGTRQNAHGVDLNRNFPAGWQPSGRAGAQQYSGSGPLSEPEARAMAGLVRQVRPTVTVWFHQPVGVVDLSGGSVAVERRFARVAHMQLKLLTRYPGSACGWQNALWPGRTTAFVVELSRPATPTQLSGTARAVLDLATL